MQFEANIKKMNVEQELAEQKNEVDEKLAIIKAEIEMTPNNFY